MSGELTQMTSATARRIAEHLEAHPAVNRVMPPVGEIRNNAVGWIQISYFYMVFKPMINMINMFDFFRCKPVGM